MTIDSTTETVDIVRRGVLWLLSYHTIVHQIQQKINKENQGGWSRRLCSLRQRIYRRSDKKLSSSGLGSWLLFWHPRDKELAGANKDDPITACACNEYISYYYYFVSPRIKWLHSFIHKLSSSSLLRTFTFYGAVQPHDNWHKASNKTGRRHHRLIPMSHVPWPIGLVLVPPILKIISFHQPTPWWPPAQLNPVDYLLQQHKGRPPHLIDPEYESLISK